MGTFDESTATLRIFSDALDPSEITQLLGNEPTFSRRKGEPIYRRGKVRGFCEKNNWSLKAKSRKPGDLDSQISEVFRSLTGDLSIWRDLTARAEAKLFCGLFMADMNEVAALSTASLGVLSARNIELLLDVYDSGEIHSRQSGKEFVGNGSDYD